MHSSFFWLGGSNARRSEICVSHSNFPLPTLNERSITLHVFMMFLCKLKVSDCRMDWRTRRYPTLCFRHGYRAAFFCPSSVCVRRRSLTRAQQASRYSIYVWARQCLMSIFSHTDDTLTFVYESTPLLNNCKAFGNVNRWEQPAPVNIRPRPTSETGA